MERKKEHGTGSGCAAVGTEAKNIAESAARQRRFCGEAAARESEAGGMSAFGGCGREALRGQAVGRRCADAGMSEVVRGDDAPDVARHGRRARGGALSDPSFAALACSQLFSLLGEAVLRFVLPLYVLNLTGSATLFGAVVAAAFVPFVIMSPVGGVLADRLPRRLMMATFDAVLAFTACAYLLLVGVADVVALTVVALMALYVVQSLYQPTVQSCVGFMLPREHVAQGVAIVSQVSALTGIVGPAAGGMVFGLFGIWPVVAASAVGFAVSCVLVLLFVRVPHVRRESAGGAFATFASDMRDAVSFLRRTPLILRVIAMVVLVNFAATSLVTVGTPYIVTEHWGMPNQFMGFAEASLAVGGLLGAALVAARPAAFSMENVSRCILAAAGALAVLAAMLALPVPAPAAYGALLLLLACVMGAGSAFSVVMMSFVQTESPTDVVGKVVALMLAAANCATPLGQLMFGAGFDHLPPWMPAGIAALVLFGIVVAWRMVLATERR